MRTKLKAIFYSIVSASILIFFSSLDITKDIQLGYGRTLHIESVSQKTITLIGMSVFFYFMIFRKKIISKKNDWILIAEGFGTDCLKAVKKYGDQIISS